MEYKTEIETSSVTKENSSTNSPYPTIKFDNVSNASFYKEHASSEKEGVLKTAAESAGLQNIIDLDLIWSDYFGPKTSVLEIGAGEGRVISGLLSKKFEGPIFAIERQPAFVSLLEKKYASNRQVQIIKGSILDEPLPTVDVALWLFAGISEFNPEEQVIALKKLAEHCSFLIVDTPLLGSLVNGEWKGQFAEYKAGDSTLSFYVPTHAQMEGYCKLTPFCLQTRQDYETATGRKRALYVLSKGKDFPLPDSKKSAFQQTF